MYFYIFICSRQWNSLSVKRRITDNGLNTSEHGRVSKHLAPRISPECPPLIESETIRAAKQGSDQTDATSILYIVQIGNKLQINSKLLWYA